MLEIINNTPSGFSPIIKNSNFLCAFITHSPMYSEGKVLKMKRHNDTDEVFVLLSGDAVLLTRDNDKEKCQVTKLSVCTTYIVKAGTWHYLALSNNGKVFVTESGAINPDNTDTIDVSSENIVAQIV